MPIRVCCPFCPCDNFRKAQSGQPCRACTLVFDHRCYLASRDTPQPRNDLHRPWASHGGALRQCLLALGTQCSCCSAFVLICFTNLVLTWWCQTSVFVGHVLAQLMLQHTRVKTLPPSLVVHAVSPTGARPLFSDHSSVTCQSRFQSCSKWQDPSRPLASCYRRYLVFGHG